MLNQKLQLKSQWKFEAEIRGFPRPTVKVYKDDELITDYKGRIVIYVEETSIMIAIYSLEAQDTGNFTIVAENSCGVKKLGAYLRVVGKSFLPFFVTSVNCFPYCCSLDSVCPISVAFVGKVNNLCAF